MLKMHDKYVNFVETPKLKKKYKIKLYENVKKYITGSRLAGGC